MKNQATGRCLATLFLALPVFSLAGPPMPGPGTLNFDGDAIGSAPDGFLWTKADSVIQFDDFTIEGH